MMQSPKGPRRKPKKGEKAKRDDEAQSERFIETARAVDPDISVFQRAIDFILGKQKDGRQ
jgi:hypothetical protein